MKFWVLLDHPFFLKQFEEINISCEVLKYSKVRTLAMQPTPAHQ
jgi:hypothetical protein